MKTSLLFTLPLATLFVPGALAENLTDNEYDDRHPQVSGDLIVWEAQVPDEVEEPPAEDEEPPPAPDWELMIRFGDQVRQLTDNDFDDINAKLSGTAVVWQSFDGNDWEIWAYEATSDAMTQLTDNDTDDINPCISGTTVVWQTMDEGGDYEIATNSIASLIPVDITVRITPRSLNLRSRGQWVNGSILLRGTDIDPAAIDPSSILLLDTVPAENVRVTGAGISMKFDREALQALLDPEASSAELTVSAATTSGEVLVGSDTIRVIR
mgnify:CR=1 FL=1